MDKFPVLRNGEPVGEMMIEQEQLYTWFDIHWTKPDAGIWCAWAIGTDGELRVGVMEPQGQQAVIRRRFSDRMAAPIGKLLRGEIRPIGETQVSWEKVENPSKVLRTPWLRQSLNGKQKLLYRRGQSYLYLAVPYQPRQPFPLTPLFCFAKLRQINGDRYLQFIFDEKEHPTFKK